MVLFLAINLVIVVAWSLVLQENFSQFMFRLVFTSVFGMALRYILQKFGFFK